MKRFKLLMAAARYIDRHPYSIGADRLLSRREQIIKQFRYLRRQSYFNRHALLLPANFDNNAIFYSHNEMCDYWQVNLYN